LREGVASAVTGCAALSLAARACVLDYGSGNVRSVANLLEYQSKDSGAYRWEGEAWRGGDLNRFVVKSQGEGTRREGLESAEIQALYSRAVTRYSDMQVGVRQDFKPGPARTYAAVGFETLLPYWLETQGGVFLSTKGDVLGRIEGTYDLRFSQRLILQPRAELNFAAKDIPSADIGSGLSKSELDLRLRYEIRREFAPYFGVSYERSYGHTADFARRAGQNVSNTSFVVGVRAWY